jgi:hypothetical protein
MELAALKREEQVDGDGDDDDGPRAPMIGR